MLFNKYFYCLVFLFTLIGCSSDSKLDSDPILIPESSFTSTFNIAINGVDTKSNAQVTRVENMFVLSASKIESLSFDKDGHFGNLTINLNTGKPTLTSLFYSFSNFSSNYINFHLISVDEVHKRVKGTLSGFVYHDPFNLNSETKFINLSFDYEYIEIIPVVKNLKNHAKINGDVWDSSNKFVTKDINNNADNITQHDVSDDEYKIMVNYNLRSISLGTYNFTADQITNNVKLAKYDLSTETYIIYDCFGTMNITQKESLSTTNSIGPFILSGIYNFTAVNQANNSDVVQVTDGSFKLVYTYF